jgi:peptidoglycan hydrolase-like protein with peptidoglycan-binding domain
LNSAVSTKPPPGTTSTHLPAFKGRLDYAKQAPRLDSLGHHSRRDLRDGMTGEDVRALQRALLGKGYRVDIDGNFGPRTERAVMDYQRDHQLKVDGLAGPLTLAALANVRVNFRPSGMKHPLIGGAVVIALGLYLGCVLALAHDGADPMSAWYRSLKTMKAAPAARKPIAFRSRRGSMNDHWEVLIGNGPLPVWEIVPPEVVLTRDNPEGRAVLCRFGGRILCFVPPAGV